MTSRPPLDLWGVDGTLQPLPGGHRNRVFRLVGGGRDLVFKSTRRSEAAMAWLPPVLAWAQRSGFTVPDLVPSQNGRFVEDGWTCETSLEGSRLSAPLTLINPMISTFHSATTRIAQRPGFSETRALSGGDASGDIQMDLMPHAVAEALLPEWTALRDLPHSVVHGDLTRANLIALPGGGVGLVDWDEARVDATVFDTSQTEAVPIPVKVERALTAWECAACWKIEPARARDLATIFIPAHTGEGAPNAH